MPGDKGATVARRDDYILPHPFKLLLLTVAMAALTLAVTLAQAAGQGAGGPPAMAPGAERQKQLVQMVRHDCGSCHGLTLAGGLGPALTPAALAHQSPHYLKLAILHGRDNTAMPEWSPILSDADAAWIAEQLQKGFPGAR